MKYIDITGQKFGKLLAISKVQNGKDNKARFLCECDCGNSVEVSSINLRRGYTTSCGCYRKEFRRNGHDPAINDLYSVYKRDAVKKGREFSLTKEEFKTLVTAPCIYCGALPNRKHRPKRLVSDLYFNGIDRKDNSLGYIISNTQTCCSICNQAKHTLSEEIFLNWIGNLIKYRTEKHGS